MTTTFRRIAQQTATVVGHANSFLAASLLIVVWLITGPLFHFSDTWQLVINTTTTIVTFLMVFLIQNTQNRDSHAIHLKLDELIRANEQARNKLLALEDLSDSDMRALQLEFERLRDGNVPMTILAAKATSSPIESNSSTPGTSDLLAKSTDP